MTTRDAMLSVCASQIGYVEGPNNDTKFGDWSGAPHQAWCDSFISWCAAQSNNAKHIGKFTYTPAHAKWFYTRSQFTKNGSSVKPKPGWIVFFNFGRANGWNGRWLGIHHVGIVESVRSDGRIVTIEGNTSSTNDANGGMVKRQVRSVSGVAGYGMPAYDPPKETVISYRVVTGWASTMAGITAITSAANAIGVKIVSNGPCFYFHADINKTKNLEQLIAFRTDLYRFHAVTSVKEQYKSMGIADGIPPTSGWSVTVK